MRPASKPSAKNPAARAPAATPALAPAAKPDAVPNPPLATVWVDVVLLGGLAFFAFCLLNLSWRKWNDPIVDFGRELYLPWRLANGAVLYRDMAHMYGPFTPYFNSLLFRLGGVSLSTLITANLVIYTAIVLLLYTLLRAGWGRLAAVAAVAVFIGVFSFSHLVGIGNYNFMTPYSHETTHGFLLVLILIPTLTSLVGDGARWKFFVAGLLCGVAVLLKPEIILAAGAVTAGAVLLLALKRFRLLPPAAWARAGGLFLLGGVLPMLLAALLFHVRAGFSWSESLADANNAWITVFSQTTVLDAPTQQSMLGVDKLWTNLLNEVLAGSLAVVIAAGLALLSRYLLAAGKTEKIAGSILLLGAIGFAAKWVNWVEVGVALPGLLVCAALLEAANWAGRPAVAAGVERKTAIRVLLACAGAAFLVRMAFNPRVYHYGFFQAPLAAVVGVATLLVALPVFLRVEGPSRKVYQGLLAALLAYGVGFVVYRSSIFYSYELQPIGEGADQFFGFDQRVDPTGALLEQARQYLAADPGAHSLVVLPEGVTLNYLTRLPSPMPYYLFDPTQIIHYGSDILQHLRTHPPDRIVLISRDLREYGVSRFGDSTPHGADIMDFINDYYQPVFGRGGDPLDDTQRGVEIYALRPEFAGHPLPR